MTQLNVYRSIVKIRYHDSPSKGEFLGSGVIISPDGIVLTNNHVIENDSFGSSFGDITVDQLSDVTKPPTESHPATLIVRNDAHDLAVLDVPSLRSNNFIPILGNTDPDAECLEKPVRVIGFPDLGGDCLTITRGIISGFDEQGNLKTDAEINHGNSGGGAFDEMGNFLGVPTFIISGDAGKIGYIVSLARVREWLHRTLKSGLPQSESELRVALTREDIVFGIGDNLDESPRYPRILGKFAAIEMLMKEGVYENVFPQVEFILEKRPHSFLAYHYLGNVYLAVGQYDQAADAYSKALALDPYHVPARGNYAVALIHLKRTEHALEQYEALLKITNDPAEMALAYSNMGRIYALMNEKMQGTRYYQRALDVKPDCDMALDALKELESDRGGAKT
jgi:hypothetical protein